MEQTSILLPLPWNLGLVEQLGGRNGIRLAGSYFRPEASVEYCSALLRGHLNFNGQCLVLKQKGSVVNMPLTCLGEYNTGGSNLMGGR